MFFGGYSHAGQLGLGRLLVTLSETLVPFSLGIIDHPVTSLSGVSDWPWDLTECLVQRQIVTDGTLERVRIVSHLDRK